MQQVTFRSIPRQSCIRIINVPNRFRTFHLDEGLGFWKLCASYYQDSTRCILPNCQRQLWSPILPSRRYSRTKLHGSKSPKDKNIELTPQKKNKISYFYNVSACTCYRVLVGKREGMRVVDGRIILKWIFREVGWRGTNWMCLTQDRDR
jgi:hypothetical protein